VPSRLRGSWGDATLSEVKELPGQTTLANLDTLVGRIVVGAVWGTAYTPAAPTVSIAASYRPIVERYWTRPHRRRTLKR
jgi:hypothetical protein